MFRGTIHLPEDAEHLDATMVVQSGRVIIQVEGQAICEWEADAVTLEHRPDGILLSLNGESLVVSPVDRYGFSDAVEAARAEVPKKGRRRSRARERHAAPKQNGQTTGEPMKAARREKKRMRRRTHPDTPTADPALPQAPPPDPAGRETTGAPHDPWIEPSSTTRSEAQAAPDSKPKPAPEPVAPDEATPRSLSDVVRAATDSLPGRRTKRDEPVDINREIFGDDYDRPQPQRPVLPTRLRTWWRDLAPRWRAAVIIVIVGVPATIFASEAVATGLVLGGLGACLLGGAGMADPYYTRKLPSHITEIRLLIAGVAMIIAGFLVGLPSL